MVDRYNFTLNIWNEDESEEREEECEFIRYEDYEKLEQENKELLLKLQRLEELQTPKSPIWRSYCPTTCPNCKAELSQDLGDGYYKDLINIKFCECGQKLDWEGQTNE